jgi:hypothetical protein
MKANLERLRLLRALLPASATMAPVLIAPNPVEPNHYAVVILDSEGQEIRGWDFRTQDEADAFADGLGQKAVRVEVWARDEFGNKLVRLLPGPAHSYVRRVLSKIRARVLPWVSQPSARPATSSRTSGGG